MGVWVPAANDSSELSLRAPGLPPQASPMASPPTSASAVKLSYPLPTHASLRTAAATFGPILAGALAIWLVLRTLTRRMVAKARVCELERDDELVENELMSSPT